MSDESFLQRWSRLKTQTRREETRPAPAPEPAPEPDPQLPAPAETATPEPAAEEKKLELPPLESLTAESDYSVFMRPEVPEATRQAALRKLWTSDPILAAQDPLDFQNLDFTFPTVPEVVRTAYQVGKGFIDTVEKLAEEPEAGSKSAPESDSERKDT
jgi:hypothetical protein